MKVFWQSRLHLTFIILFKQYKFIPGGQKYQIIELGKFNLLHKILYSNTHNLFIVEWNKKYNSWYKALKLKILRENCSKRSKFVCGRIYRYLQEFHRSSRSIFFGNVCYRLPKCNRAFSQIKRNYFRSSQYQLMPDPRKINLNITET